MISTVIIDDERLIRMSLRQMIDWQALDLILVGEAANGPDALALIRKLRPQLVLLDINLPVMNGIEVCRALTEERIPSRVLILSGYDTFEYAQQCLRLGVLDFVVKPLEKEELYQALRAACQRIREDQNRQDRFTEGTALLSGLGEAYVCALALDESGGHLPSLDVLPGLRVLEEASDRILIISTHSLADTRNMMLHILETAGETLLSIGLCVDAVTPDRLSQCQRSALHALEERFYSGARSLNESSISDAADSPSEPLLELSELRKLAHNGEGADLSAYIDTRLARYFDTRPSRSRLNHCCEQIINALALLDMGEPLFDAAECGKWLAELERCRFAKEVRMLIWAIGSEALDRLSIRRAVHPLVRRTMIYIHENYTNPDLSLRQIANSLYVAPDHLSRVFKRSQGITITTYITQARMNIALKLISEGKVQRISDVARVVGYSDALYFSKAFKKVYGVPPSKYFPHFSTDS